jgi:hypothetical protein
MRVMVEFTMMFPTPTEIIKYESEQLFKVRFQVGTLVRTRDGKGGKARTVRVSGATGKVCGHYAPMCP